jgi:hypothetical protein
MKCHATCFKLILDLKEKNCVYAGLEAHLRSSRDLSRYHTINKGVIYFYIAEYRVAAQYKSSDYMHPLLH